MKSFKKLFAHKDFENSASHSNEIIPHEHPLNIDYDIPIQMCISTDGIIYRFDSTTSTELFRLRTKMVTTQYKDRARSNIERIDIAYAERRFFKTKNNRIVEVIRSSNNNDFTTNISFADNITKEIETTLTNSHVNEVFDYIRIKVETIVVSTTIVNKEAFDDMIEDA